MLGCHMGKQVQLTIADDYNQEAVTAILQGIPPGLILDEQAIYGELLLRKPGIDEFSAMSNGPDIPLITSGLDDHDVMNRANIRNHTNGKPITIMIPNLKQQYIKIKQHHDAAPIVGAGYVAKQVLLRYGITISSYVKKIAGVSCGHVEYKRIWEFSERYKKMRRDYDPVYQAVYVNEMLHMDMRLLEKAVVLRDIEKRLSAIQTSINMPSNEEIWDKYKVHPVLMCPDFNAADEMINAYSKINKDGEALGGMIELIVQGLPVGIDEPAFKKLDIELGKLLEIGTLNGVEIGVGFNHREMSRQDLIVRLAIKPTATIGNSLSSLTNRIWPVAENMAALIVLDQLAMHLGNQTLRQYKYP